MSATSSAVPTRLERLDEGRRRFGARVDRLVPYFAASDPLADAAVQAMAAIGLPPAAQRSLVGRALARGADQLAEAPAALVDLLTQAIRLPRWADLERCARGGRAFLRTGALGGVVLGFGTLPASYCSAGGNKPLILSGGLIDGTFQRLARTGDFVHRVCLPGALAAGGDGLAALIGVRLLHAGIRARLRRDPRWRAEAWGLPINQADMAATVLLFSSDLASGVRRLGGVFTAADEEDLVHLWRCAGHVLGVDGELLCGSRADAAELLDLIGVIDGGPDDDSRRLVEALFGPALFGADLPHPRLARPLRALHMAVTRCLLGDARADALGLPPSALAALTVKGARPWITAATLAGRLPFAERAQVSAGVAYWRGFARNLRPTTSLGAA